MLHRPSPRRRRTALAVAGLVTAAALTGTAFAVASDGGPSGPGTVGPVGAPQPAGAATEFAVTAGTGTSVDSSPPNSPGSPLEVARVRTRDVPQDAAGWSGLALMALEAGRASGDPALYAEARTAADTSLRVQPVDNDLALAALAALADAEHDFATARAEALRALAVNPRSPIALAALTDALTELGRVDEALAAARRLDTVRPGVASFTRLSYQAELRGRPAQARELMVRAAQDATTGPQVAFARAQEGLLALSTGDVAGAVAALQAGRAVAPDDVALLHLEARIAIGGGDLRGAADLCALLVARRATPAFAAEQAEVLVALGDRRGAATALDVVRAGYALQAASGVRAEGVQVLFEADHGDPATAVRLGREVFRRSPTSGNADALGWALHRSGDDRAALALADRALALGGQPAGFRYHRGAVRAALGDRTGAVGDLRAALTGRPNFSPVDAPAARRLLTDLEARS